jgi:hypothetical protein
MAFHRTSDLTPLQRLILTHYAQHPEPQSAIAISDATQCSYWTARALLIDLVKRGAIIKTMQGNSPHYALPQVAASAEVL